MDGHPADDPPVDVLNPVNDGPLIELLRQNVPVDDPPVMDPDLMEAAPALPMDIPNAPVIPAMEPAAEPAENIDDIINEIGHGIIDEAVAHHEAAIANGQIDHPVPNGLDILDGLNPFGDPADLPGLNEDPFFEPQPRDPRPPRVPVVPTLPTTPLDFLAGHLLHYHNPGPDASCAICTEPYVLPTASSASTHEPTHCVLVVNIPGCNGHHFHLNCMLELMTSDLDMRFACPFCRSPWMRVAPQAPNPPAAFQAAHRGIIGGGARAGGVLPVGRGDGLGAAMANPLANPLANGMRRFDELQEVMDEGRAQVREIADVVIGGRAGRDADPRAAMAVLNEHFARLEQARGEQRGVLGAELARIEERGRRREEDQANWRRAQLVLDRARAEEQRMFQRIIDRFGNPGMRVVNRFVELPVPVEEQGGRGGGRAVPVEEVEDAIEEVEEAVEEPRRAWYQRLQLHPNDGATFLLVAAAAWVYQLYLDGHMDARPGPGAASGVEGDNDTAKAWRVRRCSPDYGSFFLSGYGSDEAFWRF